MKPLLATPYLFQKKQEPKKRDRSESESFHWAEELGREMARQRERRILELLYRGEI